MDWTEIYLSPIIQTEKISSAIRRIFRDFFIMIKFGLLPHSPDVKKPQNDLPEIKDLTESGLKAIEKIYDASLESIENLERKAFYLLSYITASFTMIALLYTLFSDYSSRIFLLIPIITLLITFFISFRCLKIKSTQQVFIGDVYRFEGKDKPITKGEELHINYLRATIYNEVKAAETADMLKAARMFLIISMLLLFIAVGGMMGYGADPKMPLEENIHLQTIAGNIHKIDNSLTLISHELINSESQKQKIDSLNIQVSLLKKELDKRIIKKQVKLN